MTKLRKKLLLSVLTLALTFIALGSTTFAWFTLGNNATANAFTGTVQGGQGIDIAFVDSENLIESDVNNYKKYDWKRSIDLSEKVLPALTFKDLTSTDGRDIKTIAGADAGENDYVDVSFYVRSMGTLSALNLTSFIDVNSDNFTWNPDANVLAADSTEENIKYQFQVGNGVSWNALNALRVSFTVGEATPATNVFEFDFNNNHLYADDSAAGLAKRYADAKKYDITCPESSAVLKDTNTIKVGTSTDKINGNQQINITAVNLLNKNAVNADKAGSYELDGVTYNIYKVTLRVWMEGWDGDCINAIFAKKVKLGFALEASYGA